MSDAYNVRYDGQRYWVYRMDGNVPVGEFLTGADAQRNAAIQNQRYNEQMGKKKVKEEESLAGQQSSETSDGEVQTRPYPVPQPTEPKAGKTYQVPKAPNPPPGQGASY